MAISVNLSTDTTIGNYVFWEKSYSTNRLSGIMQEIAGAVPRVQGVLPEYPTQEQLTRVVVEIWRALGGEVV